MHAHLILEPWEWISVKDHETENEYLLTILVNTIYRVGCKTYLDLRLKELWTVFRLQIQFQMKKRGISFRPVEGKLTNKYKCMFCFFMLWLMTMMMFLFLLLFYPRNFQFKFFFKILKNIGSEKMLRLKKICRSAKIFMSEKNLDRKNVESQKNFGSKKLWDSKKKVGSENFFGS